MHQRECQGADDPTDPDSDYELWTPNGRISPDCLLGRSITYTRRKREAKCFNPEQWERVKYVKNCKCTEEDWECDEGFVRHGDGECKSENGQLISEDPPKYCKGYYEITQGYRKVAGDSCFGGINHEPL